MAHMGSTHNLLSFHTAGSYVLRYVLRMCYVTAQARYTRDDTQEAVQVGSELFLQASLAV